MGVSSIPDTQLDMYSLLRQPPSLSLSLFWSLHQRPLRSHGLESVIPPLVPNKSR